MHPVIVVALTVWWVFPAMLTAGFLALLRLEGGKP